MATKRATKRREKERRRELRELGSGRYQRRRRLIRRSAVVEAEQRAEAAHADGEHPCADPQEPTPGGVWATVSSERYGNRDIYGAVCGRVWIGDPGDSELICRLSFTFERIKKADLAQEEWKARAQIEDLLVGDYAQATGLDGLDVERIEWLISWSADGHLLDRCAAFEAGYIKRSRPAPSEMTLDDIKRAAKDWGGPVPQSMPRKTTSFDDVQVG